MRRKHRVYPAWALLLPLYLTIAGVAIWYLALERRIAGEWGFALDDSWIHATMARNLATGHGLSFNPGESIAGSTAPLYTSLLALFYLVFHDVVWSAKIFGVICQCAAATMIYFTILRVYPHRTLPAFLGASLVGLSPSLVWASLSGMEISLYLLLVCAGLYCLERGWTGRATLLWSIGVWVRPDGIFLVALSLALGWRAWKRNVLAAAPVLLAFFAFHYALAGRLFPQTVGAKAHFGIDMVGRTWHLLADWLALWGVTYGRRDLLEQPPLLLAFLALGAAIAFRRRPLVAIYAIGYALALSLFREHSGSHKRYILYVIPFGMILAVMAMEFLSRRIWPARAREMLLVMGMACLIWQVSCLGSMRETYAWNVQNINKMQRLLANFARVATKSGDVIATNDIGAFGYFSDRYVVDLMGLASPFRPLPENLSHYRPKVIFVFLHWFREYLQPDPASGNFRFWDADSTHRYDLIAGVELKHNTVCANTRMTAYIRLDRDDPPPEKRWLYVY